MPNLQYAKQTFHSLQSTCKVLNLWNGTSNNAAPSGWEQPGFDDSAWALSSVPDSNTGPAALGSAEIVAPWTAPTAYAVMLFRQHFTAPNATWQYFTHDMASVAGATIFLWLNGSTLNLTSALARKAGTAAATALLIPGADNLVAGIAAPVSSIGATGGPFSAWGAGNPPAPPFYGWAAWEIVLFQPLSVAGTAYSWGTITTSVNDKGVLGVGDTITHLTPTPVDRTNLPSGSYFAKASSNGKTTLLLTYDGDVYGCGDNSTGMAMANGSTDSSTHATPVFFSGTNLGGIGGQQVIDIGIGEDCAMALDRWGQVFMWGPNAHGSLGRGNTTPSNTIIVIPVGAVAIGAGRTFSVTSNRVAGDNTYGQLGIGSSGSDVITRQPGGSGGITGDDVCIAAGDDQLIVSALNPNTLTPSYTIFGTGRAEYGSLGYTAFSTGTGIHKIVNTPVSIPANNPIGLISAQAGPLSFNLPSLDPTNDTFISVFGDGLPHGGAGDSINSIVWGESSPFAINGVVDLVDPIGLPTSSGSQNPYTSGNSQAAFGAIGSDNKLYTWGWGGFGQMGSGSDPTNNITPVSINGLHGVIAAGYAAQIFFVIADHADPNAVISIGFAQVIG